MKPFVTSGLVEAGVLKALRNRKALDAWAVELHDAEIIVTFEKAHATRNVDQNALYWVGYVNPIAEYTGNSPKWVHAYLKSKFLPKQRITIVDKKTGVIVDECDLEQLTTTVLTKLEFSDYLSDIAEWVAEEFHGQVVVGSNRRAA